MPLDGHLLRLEGQRPVATRHRELNQGRLQLSLAGDLDVRAIPLGGLGVAGISGQQATTVSRSSMAALELTSPER